MNAELWRRAEELFHAALERPPEARRTFVDTACGEDPDLRRLVETLLANDVQADGFLEPPAAAVVSGAHGARGSLVGESLGRYRVVSFIGGGGMGEVYRAHDGKLARDVAIKTLPPEFARDPERLARFWREARALAALNHPNIAAIYGLEETAGVDYLVLELVEGDSPRGPLPAVTALDIAAQVAAALDAAHQHGIVHRDLKPENLKVTPQGTVKVLDFGLAKAIWAKEAPDLAQPPAVTDRRTAAGQILGTPGYMSPEQARGGEVDQRTDIWAFGCLLYELLAGKRAFAGTTVTDIMKAVLEHEPDWPALPRGTPAKVANLLHRCLEKDASRRLGEIAEAGAAVQDARRGAARRPPRRTAAAPAPTRRPAARVRALAVLPLANLGGDPEQEYFADGMTEALITELAGIRALRVISRTSAMHYKRTTKTVPEIARELNVDAIVEGSVTRGSDRVRITAQLIHAASDHHLWASSYERDARDVLQLQGEVARAIVEEIQVTLTPRERSRLSRVRHVDVDSHEAFLRGHHHWGRAQPDRSIDAFKRAIAIDPDNAAAYAGLADAQCMLYGAAIQASPPSQLAPMARAAALKALELDDSLAEPHVTLARVGFWYDRDPIGAERELRQAIRLGPNCAMAHFHCGMLFADLRRTNESIAAYRRALQLDPVSCWNSTIAGWSLYELGQHEMGREQLQKALELDPNFYYSRSALSVIHCYEGRFDEAIAESQEGVRLSGGLPVTRGWAAYALARAGRKAEALAIVDELDALSRQRYVSASTRVWCYLGQDDHERALEWLEKGYEERDSGLPHVGIFRAFDLLAAEPRFRDLCRRLGLSP
jgi:eukaryotic-like serine/threonine-protein kinase